MSHSDPVSILLPWGWLAADIHYPGCKYSALNCCLKATLILLNSTLFGEFWRLFISILLGHLRSPRTSFCVPSMHMKVSRKANGCGELCYVIVRRTESSQHLHSMSKLINYQESPEESRAFCINTDYNPVSKWVILGILCLQLLQCFKVNICEGRIMANQLELLQAIKS